MHSHHVPMCYNRRKIYSNTQAYTFTKPHRTKIPIECIRRMTICKIYLHNGSYNFKFALKRKPSVTKNEMKEEKNHTQKREREREKGQKQNGMAQNILCVFDVWYTNLSLCAYTNNNVAHIILFVCVCVEFLVIFFHFSLSIFSWILWIHNNVSVEANTRRVQERERDSCAHICVRWQKRTEKIKKASTTIKISSGKNEKINEFWIHGCGCDGVQFFCTLQNRITWPATMNVHMHWKRSPRSLYVYSVLLQSLFHSSQFFNFSCISFFFASSPHFRLLFSWMFPLFVGPSHSSFFCTDLSHFRTWYYIFVGIISSTIEMFMFFLLLMIDRQHNKAVYTRAHALRSTAGSRTRKRARELRRDELCAHGLLCGFIENHLMFGRQRIHEKKMKEKKNKWTKTEYKTKISQKCQHLLLKNIKSTVEIKTVPW